MDRKLRRSTIFVVMGALALVAICVAVFPTARASQRRVTPMYKAVVCTPNCVYNDAALRTVVGTDAQNVYLTALIPNCHLNQLWDPLSQGSIWLNFTQNQFAVLEFPLGVQRALGNYGIPLPHVEKSCKLRVQIEDSRKLMIFINRRFAYGMRYNEPVFHLGELVALPTQGINGEIQIQGIDAPKRLQWSWESFVFMLTIVGAFIAARNLAKSILPSQAGVIQVKNENRRYQVLSIGVLFLYLVAFLRWLVIRESNPGIVPNVLSAAVNTPFFQAGPRFSDFFQILYASQQAAPYRYNAIDYPQGALIVTRLFGVVPDSLALALFVSISFGVIFAVVWSISSIPKLTRLILSLSFPILFAVDRGNLDLMAVALLLLGTRCSKDRPILAGTLIGIAAAVKLWPIVFILAFYKHVKFRMLFLSFLSSMAVLTGLGELLYGGSTFSAFSVQAVELGTTAFTHSSSLLSLVSLVGATLQGGGLNEALHFARLPLTLYLRIALGLFLFSMIIGQKRLSRRLLAASLFALLIPGISYAYRLGSILVPLIVELSHPNQAKRRVPWRVIIAWVLVLGPTAFWYAQNHDYSTDSVIVPSALLFFCLTLLQPGSTIWARARPGSHHRQLNDLT